MHHVHNLLSFRRVAVSVQRHGSWAVLVLVFGLLLPEMACAQSGFDEPFPSDSSSSGGFLLNLNSWPVEVALLVLAFFVASFFSFLVAFPWLLRKSPPMWPLTAYGVCLCLISTVCFLTALGVFWDKLVLVTDGSTNFLTEHGLRLGVLVAWLILSAIILSVFRSNRGRATAA